MADPPSPSGASRGVEWIENHLSDTVIECRAVRTGVSRLAERHAALVLVLLFASAVVGVPLHVLLALSAAIVAGAALHRLSVVEESILVIKDFGVQLRSKSLSGAEVTKFLYGDKIRNVFIHEFIGGASVHYSLAFVLHGEARLSLGFRHVYPGFAALQRAYSIITSKKDPN